MRKHAASGASVSPAPGLVVVGSYQPSTTQQVQNLLAASDLRPRAIEISVRDVLEDRFEPADTGRQLDEALAAGELPVLYTSRELVTGQDNLAIGRRVTQALLAALHAMQTRPRFVIAKGGITSHEV